MFETSLAGIMHGFTIALAPANLGWCFLGVLIGNIVGVLPGLGVMATISILLPLTFAMKPVAAILMLSGIYYGAQYGGAICSILLNLPCHPPHAITCLDGYPMTVKGKGGTALSITMLSSFVGASIGIIQMMFFAPLLVSVAVNFGAAETCPLMLLGLLAGSTLGRGSALKGVAMTVLGLLLGLVGSDPVSGAGRFTFGSLSLFNGIDIVALALGVFGLAEFMKSVNRINPPNGGRTRMRLRDMQPSRQELRQAFFPMLRGTLVGSLCSLVPGTGPTIASFIAYAGEKKLSRTPERFGYGAIEGVAAPEASTHSAVQGDFIPTMSLGIPGDAVMALILGALVIQGVQPGPALIAEHPDVFWGLIASFWVGNILLLVLNIPLIGIWVKLLAIPYRYLFPAALLFISVGVYSVNSDLFEVAETMAIGVFGYVLMRLGFHPAPILLGFVLGPRFEENFRRAMSLSRGDLTVFVESPLAAFFVGLCVLLLAAQIFFALRPRRTLRPPRRQPMASSSKTPDPLHSPSSRDRNDPAPAPYRDRAHHRPAFHRDHRRDRGYDQVRRSDL